MHLAHIARVRLGEPEYSEFSGEARARGDPSRSGYNGETEATGRVLTIGFRAECLVCSRLRMHLSAS